MFGLFDKEEKTEEIEAIDKILNSIYALEGEMYNDEIAQVDRERAATLRTFYSTLLNSCKGNTEEEKAYEDVVAACVLVEQNPNPQNKRLLDKRLEIAMMFE